MPASFANCWYSRPIGSRASKGYGITCVTTTPRAFSPSSVTYAVDEVLESEKNWVREPFARSFFTIDAQIFGMQKPSVAEGAVFAIWSTAASTSVCPRGIAATALEIGRAH